MPDDGLAGAPADAGGGTGSAASSTGGVSGVGAGSSTGGALGGADSGGSDSGGSDSGGSESGGASSGGSGSGGTSTVLTVTTQDDEQDAGATMGSPGGAGLSLREAITIANEDVGHQQIVFQSAPFNITLTSKWPTITETAEILGNQTSLYAASAGTSAPCISVNASDVAIDNLWIFDCPSQPVAFLAGSGSGNVMTNCYVSNNAQPATFYGDAPTVFYNYWTGSDATAIDVYANDAQILANIIIDPAGAGIRLRDTADGAHLLANAIAGASPAVELGALDGAQLWHNTIADAVGDGVSLTGTTNVDFRNNIVSGADQFGVDGNSGQFTYFDYNLYYDNTSGNCSSCTLSSSDRQGNPLFVNPGADEYTLQAGSPAIDAGIDLGDDRNLGSPGLFNGTAPDCGFVER